MFKRELKINFKSFIIWTSILISIFLFVFLIYPSIVASNNLDELDEMLKMFPEDLLKAFNMDISSLSSPFGWIKSEGFIFVLLVTSSYSGILGASILLKEENDKTIEYLNSVPVTRLKIVLNKVFCGLLYIVLMVAIIGIFNYVGLELSEDFDRKAYILLSITPLFPSLVTFALCLFVSTFTHKTKNIVGVSLGIVFLSYFLNIVSEMSESIEFLKYISIFTLADVRNVILDIKINPLIIIVSLGLALLFIGFTILRYEKKELV